MYICMYMQANLTQEISSREVEESNKELTLLTFGIPASCRRGLFI